MRKNDLKIDTTYQITLQKLFIFEFASFLGRTFLNKPPKVIRRNKPNLLNLGCGSDKFDDWINADFFQGFRFWMNFPSKPDWMVDLRFPLKCKNNIWDGVFCEHTLEHLYPQHALILLNELYRTMKVNTYLRITVPDLEKYVHHYLKPNSDEKFNQWDSGCEAIRSLTQNYCHLSLWNYELLEKYLKEAGFKNIKKVNFQEGSDKRLLKDNKDRKWETLYVEAQKID